jgi:hypothetical protein
MYRREELGIDHKDKGLMDWRNNVRNSRIN